MILPGLLLAYEWIFASSGTQPSTGAHAESMATTCHSEPFAVILSPSLVIPSGAKNLALPLRVNSAEDLARDAQGKLREESRSASDESTNQDRGKIPRFDRNDSLFQRSRSALRGVWPFLLVVLLYLPARTCALKALSHAVTPLNLSQLAFTWPSLISFWIRHLIWPVGLSTFYDFPAVLHPTLRNFTFPLIFDVCVAAGLVALVRRSRSAAFSAVWLVLPLIPLLDLRVFVADDFAHDRYLYLPSVGLAILAGLGLKKLCARGPQASRADLKPSATPWRGAPQWLGVPGALLAASLCLAAVLAYGTVTQSFYFRDNLTFYAYNNFMAPHNLAAETNYGTILAERGMYASALAKFNEVAGHDPSYWPAVYNLGLTHYKMGRLPDAEKYFREAIRIDPHKADEYFYFGMTLLKSGRTDEAIVSTRRAIALNPAGFAYHFALGAMLRAQGDFPGALREFKEELAVNPEQQAAAAQIKEIENQLRETER